MVTAGWWCSLAAAWTIFSPDSRAAGVDLFTRQPDQIESANGELRTKLTIHYADIELNGRMAHLRVYNGKIPGPTLRVQPGEKMFVEYVNELPPNEHKGGFVGSNSPHDFNTINLHTHGLNVSPEGFSDNVLLEIKPGYWVPFEIDLPKDHPTGLFWYHPHKHGAVTVQLGSGMAGNIIIHGPGDLEDLPEIKAAKRLEMVFNEIPLIQMDDHYEVPDHPLDSLFSDTIIYAVNGVPAWDSKGETQPPLPEIHMRPGEVQHWQFTHAGLDAFLRLSITNNADGTSLPFQLVAYDGITLPNPEERNSAFLGAANRVDMLVKAGTTAATYTFASIETPKTGTVDDSAWQAVTTRAIPLASVIVSGAPMEMVLPDHLNPPLARLPDIVDSEVHLPNSSVLRHRNISFDVSVPFDFLGGSPTDGVLFTVNHKPFDGNRVDQSMLLNTAEEWTLTTDMALDHPFHIHVNWFQVLSVNDVLLPFPRWQDTVTIPINSKVRIRHRFQNYTGKFVLHCHILAHEDSGMMSLIETIDPKNFVYAGLDTDDPEGDGYPNLFHYAYGFQPFVAVPFPPGKLPIPSGLPAFKLPDAEAGSERYYNVTYDQRAAPAHEVHSILEASRDFKEWLPVNAKIVDGPVPTPGKPGFETVTLRDDTPATGPAAEPFRFLRMRLKRHDYSPLPIDPDAEEPGHVH